MCLLFIGRANNPALSPCRRSLSLQNNRGIRALPVWMLYKVSRQRSGDEGLQSGNSSRVAL